MGTSFTDINDLFMMLVKDYTLVNLFNASETDFNTYLQGWMVYAVQEFKPYCKENLSYSLTTGSFTATLSDEVKVILAQLLQKYWLTKVVQDVTQMNLHILDNDFKLFSESANLSAKKDQLNSVKETLSQLIQDYSFRNTDWSSWNSQSFGG